MRDDGTSRLAACALRGEALSEFALIGYEAEAAANVSETSRFAGLPRVPVT